MNRASITSLIVLLLAACEPGNSASRPDWRSATVYAKVGEVSYELEPGPAYSLQSLSDKEINSAIVAGLGTAVAPLIVSNLWVGVYSENRTRLEYDVGIVDSTDHPPAKEAVDLPINLSALKSIGFDIDMSDLSDEVIENAVILTFDDGESVNVPVTCRAQHLEGARPITTCSYLKLTYRANFVSINSRSGDEPDAILRNFEDGLTFIAKIEQT